jgi:hypothetical protein
MGLDMYLSKKTYIWRENRDKLKLSGLEAKVDPQKVSYIVEEAGYWRKANAIHGWFVDNVQDGVDDCKEYYVPRAKLEELLRLVEKVLANPEKANQLLPVRAGFFFGNYDPEEGYDSWYFEDMEETKKTLVAALKDPDADFYYQSSW